ncbi:MAG TPA: hypothetical protein VGQ91_02735 [Ideonella sp.]|nr:hypothetical protein [Ideonella sp.]
MRTPPALRPLAWALTASLSLGAPLAGLASERPLQTQKCNDPPPAFVAEGEGGEGAIQPAVTGKWLKPGTTRKTLGTDIAHSPELDGFVVFTKTRNFSFDAGQGMDAETAVAGTYTETIVQGTDKFCKCHLQIAVATGCVSKLAVHHYIHPLKLVADWRTDLGGMIRSKTASRTLEAPPDDSTIVTFNLANKVCAGQTSKWLLLNTSVNEVEELGTLQFIAPNGVGSPTLFQFHVPYVTP